MQDRRVLIAVPENRGMVATEFMLSICHMDRPPEGVKIHGEAGGRTVAELRNRSLQIAVDREFTHVLMVDTDHIYPGNTLMSLLSRNVPAICGLALTRKPPHLPVFGPWSEDYGGCFSPPWPTEDGPKEGAPLAGVH